MQKIKAFVPIVFVVFIFSFFSVMAHAEEMPVDVVPLFPENQNPEVKNYFSLRINETQVKQELEFLLVNRSTDEVTLEIEPLNALNSPHKGIQYTKNTEEAHTRLLEDRYALANYIEIDEQVTLKGGEEKRIRASVVLPDLDGTILGAIGFKTVVNSEEVNEEQLMIHNELNRVIGVQVDTEQAKNNQAEFVVHDPYVEPMAAYYVIRLPIAMQSSLLLQDVLLTYEVMNAEGNQLFESREELPFNMAPNTETEFALPWQHDILEENKEYVIKGELYYGDETFSFNKTFDFNEASAAQGSKDNLSRPEILKDHSTYIWLAAIILIGLGGGAFIYLRKRKNNTKKHFDEKSADIERGKVK